MDLASNLLPSFMEIAVGGIIVVIAKKYSVREAYVMIAIGLGGLGICIGVIQSDSAHAAQTALQLITVTLGLALWAHIFYGSWRESRRVEAEPGIPFSRSAMATGIPVGPPKVTPETEPLVALPGARAAVPALMKRQTTPLAVGALGIFRDITIRQVKPGNTLQFHCICTVDFYGVSAERCSPTELRMTSRGGTHVFAKLEAQRVVICPGAMVYEGFGDWAELMKLAATAAWGHSEFKGEAPHFQPHPSQNIYCDVELRIPPGEAGVRHDESTVKLESEFEKNGIQAVTIKINTWASFVGPSTTITPL